MNYYNNMELTISLVVYFDFKAFKKKPNNYMLYLK